MRKLFLPRILIVTLGPLNTVYDNTTPGHGGWLVSRNANSTATAMVAPETGKGNVLTITTTSLTQEGLTFRQEHGFLTTLWNNRTPGNNILKFEYEFYGMGTFNGGGNIISNSAVPNIISNAFQSLPVFNRILGGYRKNQ